MTKGEWAILLHEQEESQDEQKRDCAWCMTEQGLDLGNGSHGICDKHADQLVSNLHASRELAKGA